MRDEYFSALSVFQVDCVRMQDEMLAALNALLAHLVSFINTHVSQRAVDFIAMIGSLIQQLNTLKSIEFSVFADFYLRYQVFFL